MSKKAKILLGITVVVVSIVAIVGISVVWDNIQNDKNMEILIESGYTFETPREMFRLTNAWPLWCTLSSESLSEDSTSGGIMVDKDKIRKDTRIDGKLYHLVINNNGAYWWADGIDRLYYAKMDTKIPDQLSLSTFPSTKASCSYGWQINDGFFSLPDTNDFVVVKE